MSTAGKVLVVLVLLVAPVWIVMVSTVAQLNKNAGEQVAKLEEAGRDPGERRRHDDRRTSSP